MPLEYSSNKNTYRNTLPQGHYDLIIVSLVHQPPEMLFCMAKNIEKYVKGSFLWIVHYNNSEHIDENALPPWAWLVRNTLVTIRFTSLLGYAVCKTLEFLVDNVTCTNVMTLSSGSAFFREYQVPKIPKVQIISHESFFEPSKLFEHTEPIPIEHLGKCVQYLNKKGSGGWQYATGCDKDIRFHEYLKKRNFTHIRGGQWSGQVWPFDVAKMLVEDSMSMANDISLEESQYIIYAFEEILLATYAHNYAVQRGIPIEEGEVIINWAFYYDIKDIKYIEMLRDIFKRKNGHAACKLSDNVYDTVRQSLL